MSDTLQTLATAAALPRTTPRWRADTEPAATRIPGLDQPDVAVLIPCFNEETAIAKVVNDFRAVLPHARIYVYDNNSTDRTALEARAAGAQVRHEALQGKGHVVRRMFADIDAEAYILVDGDDTYEAEAAPAMVRLLFDRQLDMVSGTRGPDRTEAYRPQGQPPPDNRAPDHPPMGHPPPGPPGSRPEPYRPGHRLGNVLLSGIVRWVFGRGASDLLSGYRVFSRRFVKSFPALAAGFETEAEFTIHALALHMPLREMRTSYRGRPEGSRSKLSTIKDGLRILRTILALVGQERALQTAGLAMGVLLLAGLSLGAPVVAEFLHTGLVPRLPTALLATGLVLLGFLSLGCGLVLDAVSRGRKEMKRLAYLACAAPVRRE